MNLANTIRMLNEKRNSPPWNDDGGSDYAGVAKKIRAYAQKNGGVDKNDMMSIANQLDALAKRSTPKLLARTMANIGSLDTDVRDKIKELMKESNCMEALELDEAMVRGKEVFDKTFANRTQADAFAKKNGGRVKQVGRVFYVFKEDVNEAKEDEEPASPDESSMASKQAEFIQYVGREVAEHVKGGKEFPEWMQNKLSGLHEKAKDMHATLGDHGKKKDVKESFDELFEEVMDEARDPSKSGGSGYDLYHKDFSSAMKHAYDYAKKKFGIEIDPKEIDDKVASGPRKPSAGKTNSYRLKGKDGKKGVQIQVANLDNKKYELNMYKESVELDEAYKTPAEAGAYEAGKKAARSGKKYDDNPNKKGTAEFTAWSKGHNEARAKGMKEEVELTESPMVTFTVPNVTSDMASKLERTAKEKNIEYSRKGRTVVLKGKRIDVTMLRTKMGLAQTNIPMVPVKEEVELDEAFVKWQVKVGAKVWRGTARNAGEAVKKARPSMGNLDLSKASITRIDEEKIEETTMTLEEAREDTATQVARALKKMGVKPNAKEADIIKKSPGVLKKMGLENDKLIKRDPDFIGDVLDSMNEDIDIQEEQKISLEEAVMLSVFGEAKKVKEDNTNDKSDDGEGMDKVQPKALKKKFNDRKDKDIDNDGDTDDSDEYLHKKRQAVSKAIDKDDDEAPKKKAPPQKGKKGNGASEPVDTNPTLDEEVERIMASFEPNRFAQYGDRAEQVMELTAIKIAEKKHK